MLFKRRLTPCAFILIGALGCAPAVLSPADPENARAVDALGPEDPQVPKGPLHRPGQPCLLCHGADRDAPIFSVAGTIYRDNTSAVPLSDAEILLIDSAARRFTAHANCVGNFYVRPGEFEPVWPFWVAIRQGANDTTMASPVHREGSCATCHFEPAGPDTAGRVYLTSDDLIVPMIPTRACRPDEGRR